MPSQLMFGLLAVDVVLLAALLRGARLESDIRLLLDFIMNRVR